jgi:RimJ/RimL family protein N-acetyltransferase
MANRFVVGGEEISEDIALFVLARNGGMALGEFPFTAIGQTDGLGVLVGGVIINNYVRNGMNADCHLHVAGINRRWLSRRFLGEVYRHVFYKLGCNRTTVMIAASNQHSIDFCAGTDKKRGLGYVYEGTLRQYLANGEDMHVFGMLKSECRWLGVGELSNAHQSAARRAPTVATLHRAPNAGPFTRGASVRGLSGQ